MKLEAWLRMIAGSAVVVSLALGHWLDVRLYLLTAFVGLDLLQSAFTGWCPMMTVLRRLGVRE